MKNDVVIVIAGAGGFGKEVAGWLMSRGVPTQRFIDDTEPGCQRISEYEPLLDNEQVLVAIANPQAREQVVGTLIERGAIFHGMMFHIAPPNVGIRGGCILCPNSLVSNGAKIGEFCHVNVFSSVGHDAELGDYCTLSSHVDVTGHVKVGKRVFFGSGSRVMPGVTIGDDAVIGAGAVIMNDVPEGATMYAQPARRL